MRKPRTRLNRKRVIIAASLAALIIIVALLIATRSGRQVTASLTASLIMGGQPVNILVIANNARGGPAHDPLGLGTAAGQADVILLARLEPATHTIYAITIPRDALFAQPHWHNTVPKIKTLFFMGDQETPARGPVYLAKAVSALTGLPIDGYIVANFAGFEQAVDSVDGLTVNVKQRIYDPQNSGADFQPGMQHMNGAQALAFVRVRQNIAGNAYRTDDFQRMQAEVEVLGLLRNKLLDPAKAQTLIPKFVSKMKGDIATNMSSDRLTRIGIAMAGAPVYQVPLGTIADSMTLASVRIPGIDADGTIDEADYVILDPTTVQQRLAEFGSHSSTSGLEPQQLPAALPVNLYGSAHLALHLEHLGYARVHVRGGATGANRVVYPAAHPAWGWQVARAIGTGDIYVVPGDVRSVEVDE